MAGGDTQCIVGHRLGDEPTDGTSLAEIDIDQDAVISPLVLAETQTLVSPSAMSNFLAIRRALPHIDERAGLHGKQQRLPS